MMVSTKGRLIALYPPSSQNKPGRNTHRTGHSDIGYAYRYETEWKSGYGWKQEPIFYLWEFPILRETPKTVVIFDGNQERRILRDKKEGKQFAYLDLIAARNSFVRRKQVQYSIIERHFEEIKTVLQVLAQDWGIKDDRLPYYDEIEKVYAEELARQKDNIYDDSDFTKP